LALLLQELSAGWGRRHAIVEHFRRAAESIVLNIAEGARLASGPDKARTLDYALGSTLECAACLDIATIKGRLEGERSFVPLNVAEGNGRYSELDHRRFVEIAAASAVKAAAYLDLWVCTSRKHFLRRHKPRTGESFWAGSWPC
jgi:hypothetical protein